MRKNENKEYEPFSVSHQHHLLSKSYSCTSNITHPIVEIQTLNHNSNKNFEDWVSLHHHRDLENVYVLVVQHRLPYISLLEPIHVHKHHRNVHLLNVQIQQIPLVGTVLKYTRKEDATQNQIILLLLLLLLRLLHLLHVNYDVHFPDDVQVNVNIISVTVG